MAAARTAGGGPLPYAGAPEGSAADALGVTRSRTLFFLSIRDSMAPSSTSEPLLSGAPGDVYFDAARPSDHVAVDLPPHWVDAAEEIEAAVADLIPKLQELDRLHAQHLLPSFADTSAQKRHIESMTETITQDFRRASQLVARLALQTTEAMRARTLSFHETMAARNAQTALATKVQHMSSVFRQKQSQYLRRLQGMELVEEKKPSAWLLDEDDRMEEDMALAQQAAQHTLVDADDNMAEIVARDQEINQIARSISELATMFHDLSALVIEQGSVLDRIDYNIESMATDVQHSSVELGRAMSYQASAGRRAVMLLLVLCIILLAAILIIRPFFR